MHSPMSLLQIPRPAHYSAYLWKDGCLSPSEGQMRPEQSPLSWVRPIPHYHNIYKHRQSFNQGIIHQFELEIGNSVLTWRLKDQYQIISLFLILCLLSTTFEDATIIPQFFEATPGSNKTIFEKCQQSQPMFQKFWTKLISSSDFRQRCLHCYDLHHHCFWFIQLHRIIF